LCWCWCWCWERGGPECQGARRLEVEKYNEGEEGKEERKEGGER